MDEAGVDSVGILKKVKFNSPVILTFVMISFLALILDMITSGFTNDLIFSVYRSSPLNPLFYVRLIGHVFGHVNWEHLSGNIIMILLVGPMLEEKYGSRNLILVILATAVITGLIEITFFSNQLLGASGVAFALIILSSITSMDDGRIPITFIIVAVIYLGGQIVDGVFVKDSVSNITHIAGGLVGGACGYLINRNVKRST